ncbi:Copia protein, partial [Mucuna pruriens]
MAHDICKGLSFRTKHIEIDKHFIEEKLDSGLIVITHVPTGLQVTDVFTKGLPTTRFQELNGSWLLYQKKRKPVVSKWVYTIKIGSRPWKQKSRHWG